MWDYSYASEPFDLRLTVLRLGRCMGRILLGTAVGTLLLGGGYYLKNVVFGEKPLYEMTAVCKLEYTDPPSKSGDYYINEMTWNTYVDSDEFEGMLLESEALRAFPEAAADPDAFSMHPQGLAGSLSATVASDIHVPAFSVSTLDEGRTRVLMEAVAETLEGRFAEANPEIATLHVMDISEEELVYPDVRPVRAVILGALLSFFFVGLFYALREISADSIWLPATLRRRYGLNVLGTLESNDLAENLRFLLKEQKTVAVCTATDDMDAKEVIAAMKRKLEASQEDSTLIRALEEYIPVNHPLSEPQNMVFLHGADGVLLVVKAGLHAGKRLEYILEYLAVQDVSISAVLLWDADELLIRSYYCLPGGRR